MTTKDTLVYSQVYSILNLLGAEFIEKLPSSVYDKIVSTKDDKFLQNIKSFEEINTQNIDKEAISIIAFLHINYWSDADEKLQLQKILANNFEKNEAEKRKKYAYEDIFKNTTAKQEQIKEPQALTIQQESTFKKIFNKILEILHIKKRI